MSNINSNSVESRWRRVGVLFGGPEAEVAPDLERLLLDTARGVSGNARLFVAAVTWLVRYGNFVARHRLRRLVVGELEARYQPVLGLILETAIAAGAPRELGIAASVCRVAEEAGPLSDVQRGNAALRDLAERHATAISKAWGVWTPEVELKDDAIRPGEWVLARNGDYRARIVRKGDLRVSILESLRRDGAGKAASESELARWSGATRAAVRKAVRALVEEGEVLHLERKRGGRERAVVLRSAA